MTPRPTAPGDCLSASPATTSQGPALSLPPLGPDHVGTPPSSRLHGDSTEATGSLLSAPTMARPQAPALDLPIYGYRPSLWLSSRSSLPAPGLGPDHGATPSSRASPSPLGFMATALRPPAPSSQPRPWRDPELPLSASPSLDTGHPYGSAPEARFRLPVSAPTLSLPVPTDPGTLSSQPPSSQLPKLTFGSRTRPPHLRTPAIPVAQLPKLTSSSRSQPRPCLSQHRSTPALPALGLPPLSSRQLPQGPDGQAVLGLLSQMPSALKLTVDLLSRP